MSINGSLCGFFGATNGICQGDPISSLLFVIMDEAMGCHFKLLRETKLWKGIKVADGIGPITHAQFTNNTMLFNEAKMKEAEIIK